MWPALAAAAVLCASDAGSTATLRFSLELDGAVVSVVELQREGSVYRYRSAPLFGAAPTVDELTDLTPIPEGLWLWHQPRFGCVDGIEEITRRRGRLCVDGVSKNAVKGSIFGARFEAKYRDGELSELTLGKSHFVRGRSSLPAKNPFTAGFPLSGTRGGLQLEPAVPGARVPQVPPAAIGKDVEKARCLDVARAYVAAHPGSAVVLGLVRDGERVYPHAWVTGVDGEPLDPSAEGGQTRAGDYLELPLNQAGQVYVELLTGERLVRRVQTAAP